MKKLLFLAIISMFFALEAEAQAVTRAKSYNAPNQQVVVQAGSSNKSGARLKPAAVSGENMTDTRLLSTKNNKEVNTKEYKQVTTRINEARKLVSTRKINQ